MVGELHREGGVLQGSGAAAPLCMFSIDEQGVDAVSLNKWDFSKEDERAKFLVEVERRGPPVCTVTSRGDCTRPS